MRRANAFDRAISSRVKKVRKASPHTQKDLAGALRISTHQWRKYENGVNRIACGRLVEIARVFGIDVRSLFDDIEDCGQ